MDSIYIKKVLNGNTDAFRYFVENYKNFAFSLSYSILKNKYLAEESVQESFIKVFNKLNTFKQNSQFRTWFARIVINESLSKVAGTKDFHKIENLAETEITGVEFAMQKLLDQERKFYINQVFQRLTPEESLVLELFYLKEFTIEEISSMTGWSPSKVKMLNMRGRKNFYSKLKTILKSEMKIAL